MVRASEAILIQPLHGGDTQAFARLATGFGQGGLSGDLEGLIALGAWVAGEAAGLFLGAVSIRTKTVRVLTMHVAERYRRRGVGTRLLLRGEEAARSLGIECLTSWLAEGSPDGPAAQTLADRVGWRRLRLLGGIYKIPYRLIGNSNWVSRVQPWPDAFQVFPWKQLTEDERRILIAERAGAGASGPTLDPLEQESEQTLSSVGLRLRGEVVGWSVSWYLSAAPVDRRTMARTKLFIRSGLQRRGYGGMLLAEMIKRCPAAGIDYGMFEINAANEFMLRFAKKRLKPYAPGYREIWEIGKELPAAPGQIFESREAGTITADQTVLQTSHLTDGSPQAMTRPVQ